MSMIRTALTRFLGEEKGTATIELVLTFPVIMTIFASAFEIGLANVRHVMLERATDIVVRDLRLNTGAPPSYAEVKRLICTNAAILPDCANSLKLELRQVSTASWNWPPNDADCTDRAAPINPVRSWENGQQNELMMVRACAVFDPMFPAFGLGAMMPKDETGGYRLVSISGFVNEPL